MFLNWYIVSLEQAKKHLEEQQTACLLTELETFQLLHIIPDFLEAQQFLGQ